MRTGDDMEQNDVELGNYWRIFRRSWWMMLLAVLVMTALALLLLPRQENFFNSSVSVLLEPGQADVGPSNDPINEQTEIGVATSPIIGNRVIAANPGLDLETWAENLTITSCVDPQTNGNANSCNSNFLAISYLGTSSAESRQIVQTTAEQYLQFRVDRESSLRERDIADLQSRRDDILLRIDNEVAVLAAARDAIEEDGGESVEGTLSELRLRRLEDEEFEVRRQLGAVEDVPIDVGSLLGDASVPEAEAVGVPRAFALLAGILMGLVIGALAAILSDRLDRRISTALETESDLGVPVLGDIPRITDESPALVAAHGKHTPAANAFRRLAAAALAPRNGYIVDSIAITGATEKDGRTTASVNLALAIAQTGRAVLLVGADRRNDDLDRVFGLTDLPGLSDFLRSNGDLDAAREAIDSAETRLDISIMPSGTGPAAPLSHNALAALLAVAQERNMIVVFDAPPALTHADGLQLATVVDAVFVVAAIGRTRRSELSELRIQLVNVQADVAGAILNRTSRLNLLPTGSGDIAAANVPTGTPDSRPTAEPAASGGQTGNLASIHNLSTPSQPGPAQASPPAIAEASVPRAAGDGVAEGGA